jgi:hypothetical protein
LGGRGKEEGRRKKEEGRRKVEEGGRKMEGRWKMVGEVVRADQDMATDWHRLSTD